MPQWTSPQVRDTKEVFSQFPLMIGCTISKADNMLTNRRRYKRNATMGLMSIMWDGDSACIGVVEDVSATGIRVSQIPSHFDAHSQGHSGVVYGSLQDFKLKLQPKWQTETKKNMYKMIGFQVVNPTPKWKLFFTVILATSGVYDSLPE